jgi:hypothetical protein
MAGIELFGRERELELLAELVSGAEAGDGSLVWLQGDGGIGKTALIDAAIADARARGMAVLSARVDELERHRPFGVLVDAIGLDGDARDPRRAAVSRLLASEAATGDSPPGGALLRGGGELAFGIGEALLVLLEDECAQAPAL